jgi:hypothetical protein
MSISSKFQTGDIEADSDFMGIYDKCKDFTMTSMERMFALYAGCRYIVKDGIPGDFVECGVWKGGSAMMIAYTLLESGDSNRKIYLYDTFEGMSEPEDIDVDIIKRSARSLMNMDKEKVTHAWASIPEDEVRKNMLSTEYPDKNIFLIRGKVEETIPKKIPEKVSLLRLDTDWYASTKHELEYLYPRLSQSGILIIDDYGHWAGAKKAVDEYFANKPLIFLNRIDYTGRILIKP